jgi:hypothetical protein
MAKPTKYPDWSVNTDGTDNDVVDPTSGQNNVVEPDAGKKLTGWIYTEKPPRQYFNWLGRLTTQWIRWFDDYIASTIDVALSNLSSAVSTLQSEVETVTTGLLDRVALLQTEVETAITGLLDRVSTLRTEVETTTTGLLDRTTALETTDANDTYIVGSLVADPATEQVIDLTLPTGFTTVENLMVLSARLHKGTSTFDYMFAGTYIDANTYMYAKISPYPVHLQIVVKIGDGFGSRTMNYRVLIRKHS